MSAAWAALVFSCSAGPPPTVPALPPPVAEQAAEPGEPAAAALEKLEAPGPELLPAVRKPTRFIPGASDAARLSVPASIGVWAPGAGLPASFRSGLSEAFRLAYREASLRGIELNGALGGDLIHAWKTSARKPEERGAAGAGAYVQNWRGKESRPNSWGLGYLVLACAPVSVGRVSLVRGPLLDAYGRGGGIGGANGIAGYGAPLGDEFRLAEGLAQRFEYGLLLVKDGGRFAFFPEESPSARGVPDGVGAAPPPDSAARFGAPEAEAFRAGWVAAVNSGRIAMESDGPVFFASGAWGSVWAQTFGSGLWALVLPVDPERLGSRAKILDRPFLESVRDRTGRSLDFGEYGLPLTDSYPTTEGRAQQYEKGRMETPP